MAPRDLLRSAPRPTLDEVQREPELVLAAKRTLDEDRPQGNGRFVLTGSANLLLTHRISETLADRATYANLWPLTRRSTWGWEHPGSEPNSWRRPPTSGSGWQRGAGCPAKRGYCCVVDWCGLPFGDAT